MTFIASLNIFTLGQNFMRDQYGVVDFSMALDASHRFEVSNLIGKPFMTINHIDLFPVGE